MKKNSFVEGTIIATFSIVLVKILGMLYVIPFYATIGEVGASLYAYAYSIYSLFLDISTAGIPTAVSKIINEYHTLGKEEAKVRTYRLGKKILGFIAIIAFLALFIFAPFIAKLIIWDMQEGNSIADVTFALRCVSFALLIFPFLSVSRGLFQGHKVLTVSSFSQIIEQLVRVLIIVLGSYIAVKWLHLSITSAVGIAVFGAFFGGLAALIYIRKKIKKNKAELMLDKEFEKKDNITNKEIIKKMIKYAIPVVIISVAVAIYNNIDMILILRTMSHIGYSDIQTQFIASGISTWATKISIVITSISMGLCSSLVPNIVESFTLKKYDDVNHKFNQAMKIIAFISIPMSVGISLLSTPIWSVFYGYNEIGASLLMLCIFNPLFANFYSVCSNTLQSMNKFKMVYISSITGFVINGILDIPLMLLFDVLGIPAYWGAAVATHLGFLSGAVITMIYLKKNYQFKYTGFWKCLKNIILPLITMIIVVVLMKLMIPVNYDSKLGCVVYIMVISSVGAISYFIVAYKMSLLSDVLGNNFLNKLKSKIKRSN